MQQICTMLALLPRRFPLQTPMSMTIISEHREVLGQIQGLTL